MEQIPDEILSLNNEQLANRISYINQEITAIQSQISQYDLGMDYAKQNILDVKKKIKLYKTLPYLVANVSEIVDVDDDLLDNGSVKQIDSDLKQGVVIKTTSRMVVYLPDPGLVPRKYLSPGTLVGVSRDSFTIFERLPPEYDGKVRSMEVLEKPTDSFEDIGGLSKQVQQLKEAILLPLQSPELFEAVGVVPPKGVLLHGAPGVGKTLIARAIAHEAKCAFFRLSGTDLVQTYVGEGARLVRDIFALAREKKRAIIFIDEIDAIGTKRSSNTESGSRDVNRTMLELLNQLDGFDSNETSEGENIKVIAATNRADVLDPALLRAGRLDRKIEFPLPNEMGRKEILMIHSRQLRVSDMVDFTELAQATDDFNGAQLRAVCVEAGMHAIKRKARELVHEDFVEGISQVKAKRSEKISFYV